MVGLLAGTLALGGVGRAMADENENERGQPVTFAQLPSAAQKTLKREAKGGKIEEIRKDHGKDGTLCYTAEVVKNGQGTDVTVGADGKVLDRGKTHDEKSEHEEGEK